MELKQKYTKDEQLIKARELRTVVENIFGVNILDKSRSREIVDARIIYAKILRNNGFSLHFIGNVLAKDHSTIVHYCYEADDLIKFVPEIKKKYAICRDRFDGRLPIEYSYTKDELLAALLDAKEQIKNLSLQLQSNDTINN